MQYGYVRHHRVFTAEYYWSDLRLFFDCFAYFFIYPLRNMEYGMHWNQSEFWKSLGEVPITNINRALACHALNMLALCYLPGCIAGYIQLYRGTKYSRFPKILDRWLKMRKYLGLLMLFSACIHVRLLTCRFLSVL